MGNKLNKWQDENNSMTREGCVVLLANLKKEYLDPILTQLTGKGGSDVSFAEIISAYSAIEQDFKSQAKGARDVCAQVFFDFHPVSLEVMNQLIISYYFHKFSSAKFMVPYDVGCTYTN